MQSFRSTRLILLASFAILSPILTAAQAPAAVFNAAPNRLTLDVVATDKAGNPIRGLTKQDFTVLDNGQPAAITGFRAVDAASSGADLTAAKVLIVVDMINNPAPDVMRQREQIKDFLNKNGGQLTSPVALAAVSETGVKMLTRYYTDSHPLLAALDQLKTEIRPIGHSAGYFGATERMQQSLNVLALLTNTLARQPGRKLVLFIGPGWALLPGSGAREDARERASVFHALVQITTAMRQGQVTLYSLDPSLLKRSDVFYYQTYLKPVKKADQAEYPHLGQQVLAENSGGRALVSDNDASGAIRTVMHDAEAWYEITIEPAPGDRTNEYHELRVQTPRPSTVIRTSAGYYARPDPPQISQAPASKASQH